MQKKSDTLRYQSMMEEWAAKIPVHPLRQRFVGRWNDQGSLAWVIVEDSSGNIQFEPIRFNNWSIVINSVRWDGDTLCFHQFHYCDEEHEFNGVTNYVRFSLTDDPDALMFDTEAPAVGKSASDRLVRA